jgi:hypothetical protein
MPKSIYNMGSDIARRKNKSIQMDNIQCQLLFIDFLWFFSIFARSSSLSSGFDRHLNRSHALTTFPWKPSHRCGARASRYVQAVQVALMARLVPGMSNSHFGDVKPLFRPEATLIYTKL